MPNYEVKPVRLRDYDGHLVKAGAEWSEFAAERVNSLLMMGGITILGGVIALFSAIFYGPMGYLIGLLLIVAGGIILWLALNKPTQPRSLYFDLEGRMPMPNGIPFHETILGVGGNHEYIVSIEATGKTYRNPKPGNQWQGQAVNVALIFSGGETIYVSRDLPVEVARNVAVQLTKALEDIRGSNSGAPDAPVIVPTRPTDDDDLIE